LTHAVSTPWLVELLMATSVDSGEHTKKYFKAHSLISALTRVSKQEQLLVVPCLWIRSQIAAYISQKN